MLNVDRLAPDPSRSAAGAPFLPADLTDYGQTLEALSGAERMSGIEAVVHLAAIPSPVHATPDVVFSTNISSTHTVFAAAVRLGLERVVWASSETTLGTPFDTPPDYTPVDERHALRPESSYALSKVLGEEMARQFARWSAIPFIGLRFSNVMERADYEQFPSFWDDPHMRKWNLWGYVDEPRGAERSPGAGRRGGPQAFIIAAADTVMRRPSRELMAEVFPGVPVGEASPSTARCSGSTAPAACSATTPRSAGASCSERRHASGAARRAAASDPLRQPVVGLVPAQLVAEVAHARLLVDHQQLDPRDLGEVAEELGIERRGEHGVVGAAREEPGLGRGREVRPRLPDGARDGQLRQRLRRRDDLDLVGEQPEAVAEIEHRDDERRPGRGVEHEPHRVLAAADRQRWISQLGRPSAIDGQISSMCEPSTSGWAPSRS